MNDGLRSTPPASWISSISASPSPCAVPPWIWPATAQDVGKAMNPVALAGQIHGGTAQGLGLALMEEIQVVDGVVRNPSFTDYLIPTMLDMPPVKLDILELADPHAPYGLRGAGEPPVISATPAIVAAVRAATGRPLTKVPVRPDDIVGLPEGGSGAADVPHR